MGRKQKYTLSSSLTFLVLLLVINIVQIFSEKEQKPVPETDTIAEVDSREDEELTVQFLDVGQGSAALIKQKDQWMLVDGGDRDYSSFVVSFLKEQGVKELEYVVATHYDADHLNGIVGVLHAFSCKQILAPDYEEDTKIYQSFLQIAEEKNIPVITPGIGDVYTFAESAVEIVGPVDYEYSDANSNSIGLRLVHGENSFLICGDSTKESERDMLYYGVNLDSDVFAANHHGSNSSNTQEFLEAVSPDSVVISCGENNSYGHPGEFAISQIQKLKVDLYRTDLQGTITAVSDGEDIRFEQEPCLDYRSGKELQEEGEHSK